MHVKKLSYFLLLWLFSSQEFLEIHGAEPSEGHDAIYAFLLHQAMELAKDCLEKSQQGVISHHYFNEITNKLRTLMEDVSIQQH